VLLAAGVLVQPAQAGELAAKLNLDGLSLLSFDDTWNYSLPTQGTITFRFANPDARGGVPFTIRPEDFAIPRFALSSSKETLTLGLALPASGVLRRGPNRRPILEFDALVSGTLDRPTGSKSGTFSVSFTTETAVAHDLTGSRVLQIPGMRIDEASRSVQLVATTTAEADDAPRPGALIYAILSGRFDRLPELPR
jgi:hypothetical protein